jgi:prepilin-type N-terminal cleavage/methylation domain-containing protein
MIHFKNHDAFSLIEPVVAMAIIGILFVSISSILQLSFRKDVRYNAELNRIILLKNILYGPEVIRDKHDKELEKNQDIKEPPTTIKIDVSAQRKYKLVEKILAKATWESFVDKLDESLLLLQFRVPEKKEKT